jgi:hypothetical protein
MATNDLSDENPFNNYRPTTLREYSSGAGFNSYTPRNNDWNRNNSNNNNTPAPSSYRPNPPPPPPPQPSYRAPSPPPAPRMQPQKPNSSAPMDKTSMNMSPDNPFAEAYGRYHYPSQEEIRAQKRTNERSTRFADQQPVHNNNTNNRPVQQPPSNRMTEYPETESKDVVAGKGNTKFTRFDVNF